MVRPTVQEDVVGFLPPQCCFSACFGLVLDVNVHFCSDPLAEAGPRAGLLQWLFAATFSCVIPLAIDLAGVVAGDVVM